MDEVEGVHNGTFDYMQLKGDTGPLVYPGGFVLVYYLLYLVTDRGTNILLGQWIFVALYLATLAVVLLIYKHSKIVPLWVLPLLCLSKRIHSIFALRLFNDCFAMFFLFLSIYFMLRNRWSVACFVYSFAVGIKMNIFLFAPGLLLLLLRRFGILGTVIKLSVCAMLQLILGLPFMVTNLVGYMSRAFDLGRVFIYYWSVNWKFIPENIFLSREWGLALLSLTVSTWLLFWGVKWIRANENWKSVITLWGDTRNMSPDYMLFVLFTSNFIGVVFARSLHFQFYIWYFHTLPFLLWSTSIPTLISLIFMLLIEVVWNVFPSNAYTSLLLFFVHGTLLFYLWRASTPRVNTM